MRSLPTLIAVAMLMLQPCNILSAQSTSPACVGSPLAQLATPVAAVQADTPHVRCIAGNSCGSGTICGADNDGAYVVTNAHVTGTQLGRTVSIDCVANGQTTRTTGRTVMTGYSDSRMVDFSIVFVPELSSRRYMPMLKTEPTDLPFATTGSPRCVWPQVQKPFGDPRNYGDGLITGSPNAIGGQSGSAIYNNIGQQIALLTWSMNGRCAGQKTSKLWQVATSRNVLLADPRPDTLRELSDSLCDRPATQSGVFGHCKIFETADTSGRPVLQNMIQNVVGASMDELPIWVVPQPEPDPTPDCPDCPDVEPSDPNCVVLDATEKALIDAIRAQKTTGLRDGERAIDWARLIPLLLEFFRLLQDSR